MQDDRTTGEVWRDIKDVRQREKRRHRKQALREFDEAAEKAAGAGMELSGCDIHYQLTHPDGWIVNLYPSNGRIYADRNRPRAPFLKVPCPWGLLDVVNAAIAAIGKDSNGRDKDPMDGDASAGWKS